MKPYIVVVLDHHQLRHGFVREHDDLVEAWSEAERLNLAGERAFVAAVLVSPEVLLGISRSRSGAV